MSFAEIFAFAAVTNTDVIGIYDGQEPIGFCVILRNSECGYIYFLAIDSRLRSKGYGSAAIQELTRAYPNLQLVLDFEVIDESAENNAQRIRRRNFYLRNGFHETGNYTMLRNDRFEVVCTGDELIKPALRDLLRILHEHRPEFPDILIGGLNMKRQLGIARCGLACCLCSENDRCSGCNSGNCPDKEWCENRKCSLENQIDHCYACEEDCRKGLLSKIKPYGFTLFVKRYGEEELMDCLERNEKNGIIYHREGVFGDYDDFDDVEKLIEFIRTGKR